MTSRLLRAYPVFAVVAVTGLLLVPDDTLLQMLWEVTAGWSAAAGVALGIRHHRPGVPAAWWLFALGVVGNAGGIMVEFVLTRRPGGIGLPSWADAAYLSVYPAAAGGLLLLVRRRTRGRDWSSIIDAATLTVGLGLLAWIFMIKPAASDPSIGLSGHLVSVAYPVGDVVLLAMTVRLMIGGSGRNPSFRLLCGALLCFLGSDGAWAVVNQMDWTPGSFAGKLLADLYVLGYLLFGAAALHPDAGSVARTVAPRPVRPSRRLLILLTLTTLIGPGLLVLQTLRHRVTDGLAIALGCAALFLLVVARMSQLLTELDAQSRRIRELAVTDELTGLPNRRAWNTELPRALEGVRRSGRPLAVAIIDLDHFKLFNDAFGHPAGDRLLKEAAAAWQGEVRAGDHLARYGGEEFVVVFPDTTPATARDIVDRMRLATPLGQSFSAGLAGWDGVETPDELTARADAALYRAKNAGRNRIADAEPIPG